MSRFFMAILVIIPLLFFLNYHSSWGSIEPIAFLLTSNNSVNTEKKKKLEKFYNITRKLSFYKKMAKNKVLCCFKPFFSSSLAFSVRKGKKKKLKGTENQKVGLKMCQRQKKESNKMHAFGFSAVCFASHASWLCCVMIFHVADCLCMRS